VRFKVRCGSAYSPPYFSSHVSAYLGAILIAGAIAGIFLWRDVHRMQAWAQLLESERAQLSVLQRDAALARRHARKMQAMDGPDMPGGRPAIALLEAIEQAWSEEVCLLRVTADLSKSRMRLEIMAVSNDALFDFVAGLKHRFGEQVFVERQADRPYDAQSGDGSWRRDASVVVSW
jgi:hypothetical protein